MGKFITPIILIAITVVLYFVWISPMYGDVKTLQAKHASLADALDKSKQIQSLIGNLEASYNQIPPDQMTRLTKMVPDNIDNVRLLIEIVGIASGDGMSIADLNVPPQPKAVSGAVGTDNGGYGTYSFSFTVHGTYDNFITFLSSLSSSLRLSDISSLSFAAGSAQGNQYDFAIDLDTYWLR